MQPYARSVREAFNAFTSALNNTDYEINQATASALVQDVANRNDVQRQIAAKKEQQHAEFLQLHVVGKQTHLRP